MRTVEIKLTGGDGATRVRQNEHQTRRYLFPDGIERIISYPRRIWDIFDHLTIDGGTPKQEWFLAAIEFAENEQSRSDRAAFEQRVRQELKTLLLASSYDDWRNEKSTANDFDIGNLISRI